MDLIDRQTAIDGKILIQRTNGIEIYSDEAVPVEYLKALPSAQPEIVRCKDCKHYHTDVFGRELGIKGMYGLYENLIVGHSACDRWSENMSFVTPDGFCFLAERRTDE